MKVARALSSKREENIVRILMVLGVIRVLQALVLQTTWAAWEWVVLSEERGDEKAKSSNKGRWGSAYKETRISGLLLGKCADTI
jgi:hypothetical protein